MTRIVAGASRFFLSDQIEIDHQMLLGHGKGCLQLIYRSMIEILFEHPWFLVINKPFGLLSQSVDGVESVQKELVHQLYLRNPIGPKPFVGMPHRLDRVTTGVMVVARNQRALKRLSEQFAGRIVEKKYVAVVPGPIRLSHRLVDYVRKIPDQPKAEVVLPDAEGAKEAILEYRILREQRIRLKDSWVDVAFVEIELETGRMHQIRLQFATHGHPILGDRLYGSSIEWRDPSIQDREPPIALHAFSISFRHPQSGERISFEAPLPTGWPTGVGVLDQ